MKRRSLFALVGISAFAATLFAQQDAPSEKEENKLFITLRGLPEFSSVPASTEVAKLLLRFRRSAMTDDDCAAFFKELAGKGGMNRVMEVQTLIRNAAPPGEDGVKFLQAFFGQSFDKGGTLVESKLLSWRRNVTNDGIANVASLFKGRKSGSSVWIGEVGKWWKQHDTAFTMAGDIDFSFISNDPSIIREMKKAFDAYILERTGLTTIEFDSVCTAHGKGALNVYTGEPGKLFGDSDMVEKDATLRRVDLETGTVVANREPARVILPLLALEARFARTQSGIPTPAQRKDPGLSMEMARHFYGDIMMKKQNYDPVDCILKACKYLNRSNAAAKEFSADFEPPDKVLSEFASAVKAAEERSDWKEVARLCEGYFKDAIVLEPVGSGRVRARIEPNAAAVDRIFSQCLDAMWKNVARGVELSTRQIVAETERLAKMVPRDEKAIDQFRADTVALRDMIEGELKAFSSQKHGAPVPPEIEASCRALLRKISDATFRIGFRPISEQDLKGKKHIEELIKSEMEPLQVLAKAHIVDLASKAIDGPNNVLDYLDNALLEKLIRTGDTDFESFIRDVKEVRHLIEKGGPKQSLPQEIKQTIQILRDTRAVQYTRDINTAMNDFLTATAARRGAIRVMTAVNLVQELQAYYQAGCEGGLDGLAIEYFRRRAPGGAVADAYFQENYLRAGVEVVYAMFPPVAIPEGLWAMVNAAGEWSVGKLNDWNYEAVVDEIYAGAEFTRGGVGEPWKMARLTYKDPVKGTFVLAGNDIFTLTDKSPTVWRLFIPHVKRHPVIAVFEEMLDNKAVSDGRDTSYFALWPAQVSGLSPYGARLYDQYRKRIDQVTREYLKGVIAELERRKGWETGTDFAKVLRIEKELGCPQGSLTYAGSVKEDQKRFESLIRAYRAVRKTNGLLSDLRAGWDAEFLSEFKPACSEKSLQQAGDEAEALGPALRKAVETARADVEGIVGAEECSEANLARPIRCRLGMAFFASRPQQARKWEKEYAEALAALRSMVEAPVKVTLRASGRITVGEQVEITALYNREPKDCAAAWEIVGGPSDTISKKGLRGALWVPATPGDRTIMLTVVDPRTTDKPVTAVLPVTVLPPAKPGAKEEKEPAPPQPPGAAKTPKPGEKEIAGSVKPPEKPTPSGPAEKPGKDKTPGPGGLTRASEPKPGADQAPEGSYFTATVPSNWTGAYSDDGLVLTRKPVVRMRGTEETARVNGRINLTIGPTMPGSAGQTASQLRDEVSKYLLGNMLPAAAAGRYEAEVVDWNVGDFKGFLRQTTAMVYGYQGSEYGYVDVAYPQAGVAGSGRAPGGSRDIWVTYTGGGGGLARGAPESWSYDDMEFVKAETLAVWAEIKSIMASVKLAGRQGFSTVPASDVAKAPPVEPGKKVSVKLVPSKTGVIMPAESITVTAVVENAPAGGSPAFAWTGDVAGKGASVTFVSRKPGKHRTAVSVSGSSGFLGSASLDLEVAGVSVDIGMSPPSRAVVSGTHVAFTARVTAGGRPLTGSYVFRWESDAGVAFTENESSSPRTSATLVRPGKTRIWVVVLERQGAVLGTLAESDPIDIEVAALSARIVFEPAQPRVGEDVRARIATEPAISDTEAHVRWTPLPDNAKLTALPSEREIVFYLRDTKPVHVQARVAAGYTGDDLGEAEGTITARLYDVRVVGPRSLGSAPRIWKDGAGLVDAPAGAIAVFQDVALSVEVAPPPTRTPLRYQWGATPEGCTLSNPNASETRANAGSVGDYEVQIAVRDANNVVLGVGAGRVQVTISHEQTRAPLPAPGATQKLAQAREARGRGDFDAAIALAEEAARLDPRNKEAKAFAENCRADLAMVQVQLERMNSMLAEGRMTDAKMYLDAAKALGPRCPAVIEAENSFQAAAQEKREAEPTPRPTATSTSGPPPAPAPLQVAVTPARHTLTAGEKVKTATTVQGGVPPYRYEWYDGDKKTDLAFAAVIWTMRKRGDNTFTVVVHDSAGHSARATSRITVLEPVAPAPSAPTPTAPPVKAPTLTMAASPRPGGQETIIFDNGSTVSGKTGVSKYPSFTVKKPCTITYIYTYHWAGKNPPGTIALRSSTGVAYGPWQAAGRASSPRPDWYWEVFPHVTIPAGTYTIVDSDPASWTESISSSAVGTAQVKGVF